MISKKEWEKIDGERMAAVVAKYNAEVTVGLISKVKKAPRKEDVYNEVEDKCDLGYGVYGKDGRRIRFTPKDLGYKKNKESKSKLRDYIFYDAIGDE